MKHNTFGQLFCGQMRQRFNLDGVGPITSGIKLTAFHRKNVTRTVKYGGGGSVMVWGCFAASGAGRLAIIDGTMNSMLYQKIMKENVRQAVCEFLGYAAGQ